MNGYLSKHVNTGILDQDIFLTLIDNVTKLSHSMMDGEHYIFRTRTDLAFVVHKEGTDTSLCLASTNQRPVLCQHRPIRSLTVDLWSGCGRQTVLMFPPQPDNSCCCFILFQIQKLFWDIFKRFDLDKKHFAGLRKIRDEIWVLNYQLCLWKKDSSSSLRYKSHLFR